MQGYRRATGAVLASLIVAEAAAAAAPAGPDYPASTSESEILRWVAARTSIARGMILMIEPRAVIALAVRPSPPGGALVRAELREELTGEDAKIRSARFLVDLDCSSRRYRIVERRMYALPDLKGEPQTDLQARPWAPVEEASPIARAWQAACTPGFIYPYASLAVATAPTAPPPRPPAPRIQAAAAGPPVSQTPAWQGPSSPTPPTSRPVIAGRYSAVLGSYTVRANATAASEKVDRILASQMFGRRKALIAATVKGVSYTVLTVSGFASAAEAAGFCEAARAIPLECLAKRSGD